MTTNINTETTDGETKIIVPKEDEVPVEQETTNSESQPTLPPDFVPDSTLGASEAELEAQIAANEADAALNKFLEDLRNSGMLGGIDLPSTGDPFEIEIVNSLVTAVLSDYFAEQPELRIEIMAKFGIDEAEFMSKMGGFVAQELLEGTLPEEVSLLLDAYRAYNSVENAQETLSQWYVPGDNVNDVLGKLLEHYRAQFAWDLRASVNDPILRWIDNNVNVLQGTSGITNYLNTSFSAFIHMIDVAKADGVGLLDYQKMYELQLYYTFGILGSLVENIDISWPEFSKLLGSNSIEIATTGDDSLITSVLYTVGALLAHTNVTKSISVDNLVNILNSFTSSALQKFAFMENDWQRIAGPYYMILGFVASGLGVKGASVSSFSSWLKSKGITQLTLPVGTSGRVLLVVPGRIGPDIVLVDKANISNLSKALNLLDSVTSGVPAALKHIAKTLIVASGFVPYYVDDINTTKLFLGILKPMVDGLIASMMSIVGNRGNAIEEPLRIPGSGIVTPSVPNIDVPPISEIIPESVAPPISGIQDPIGFPIVAPQPGTSIIPSVVSPALAPTVPSFVNPKSFQIFMDYWNTMYKSVADKVGYVKDAINTIADVKKVVNDVVIEDGGSAPSSEDATQPPSSPDSDLPNQGLPELLTGLMGGSPKIKPDAADLEGNLGQSEGLRKITVDRKEKTRYLDD